MPNLLEAKTRRDSLGRVWIEAILWLGIVVGETILGHLNIKDMYLACVEELRDCICVADPKLLIGNSPSQVVRDCIMLTLFLKFLYLA